MRERITELSQARLVIGGALKVKSGLVPGVVEEIWLSHGSNHYTSSADSGARRVP